MRIALIGGRALVVGLLLTIPLVAAARTKTDSTWTSPEVKPTAYKKVVVLAKFTDDVAVRSLEDAVVAGLKKQGVDAVQAYLVLTPADLATRESIAAKAVELGADAGIVFTVTSNATQAQAAPSVSVGVGVPVHAGPFSLFVGTSVPLGGGTSTVKAIGVKAQFFAKDVDGPLWIASYTTDLKSGTEGEARGLAGLMLKQLKKAGVFAK